MAILIWNDQLKVGIDSVDQQHQRLVEILNQLDQAIALGAAPSAKLKLIEALIDYTQYHFQHEENLMRDAGYTADKFDEHCRQHQGFIEKVLTAQAQAQIEPDSVLNGLMDFLMAWLSAHILYSDKQMAMTLNQQSVDVDPLIKQRTEIMQSNLFIALRESERRFRELADYLPALIWLSNPKQVLLFCNQSCAQAFGLDRNQLDREQWLQRIDELDRGRVLQAYLQATASQQPIQVEYRIHRDDQPPIWILESVVPRLRGKDKFVGLMGCGVDISAQKTTEAELERLVAARTQELQAANAQLLQEKTQQTELNRQLQEAQASLMQSEKMASIGQLAAGVAHEINNPLGYIYSNLNTLRQYLKDLLNLGQAADGLAGCLPETEPAQAKFRRLQKAVDWDFIKQDLPELVEEAMEGAVRAKKIVQDLRDFSRSSSQQALPFDLEAGLDATLNIVHNEIKFKAEVIKQYAGLTPFACVGEQLNQVFMNLLINAAQAIAEFGKIYIRTGYQDADWLWVEIEDTGCGIAEDQQGRIFDPFFTTKPVGQGTGLGLSLSYKIVHDHGGRIELKSAPGCGSIFRVYLPCHALSGGESNHE